MRNLSWLCVLILGCGSESAPPPAPKKAASKPPAPPSAPAPAAVPAAAPDLTLKILEKADESFERAKMLYREAVDTRSDSALAEAGFAAEDARNKYQVLADSAEGDRGADARGRLVEVNQLLKLVHDARKSAQAPIAPKPEPPPIVAKTEPPPPPPAPEQEPEPAQQPPPPPTQPAPEPKPEPAKFIELFKDYVGAPDSAKVQAARDAALETPPELKPFGQAIATILGRPERLHVFARSPEREAFAKVLAKHDPVAKGLDQIQAALADITAARSETGALRLWGIAYLSRGSALGLAEGDLMKWVAKLGMISKGSASKRSIGPREGLEMKELDDEVAQGDAERAIRGARLVKDEDFQAHTALLWLQAWDLERDPAKKKQSMPELEKHFRTVKVAPSFNDLFRHISDSLRRGAPCVPCGGTGTADCDQCEDGRLVGRCGDCNGTGQDRTKRRGLIRCERCEGKGQILKDKCKPCKGQGTSPCSTCTGKPWDPPTYADLVGTAPCGVCSERGFILEPFWTPCEECVGFGKKPFKP